MKDISFYFRPAEIPEEVNEQTLGTRMHRHTDGEFPEINKPGIAFFTVPEYRNSTLRAASPDYSILRAALNKLHFQHTWKFELYDLGSILPGETTGDTYFAVANACSELVKANILPVIIGGSQDLTYALYKAYEKLEQTVNLCCVDRTLNLGDPEGELSSNAFIGKILVERPCYLFNHAVIGCQAPYLAARETDLFDKLYFDICRLGEFNQDFKKAEPHLRNADILSLDLSSVRHADYNAPEAKPNGFYADQICQIARYAGISDKLSAFGIFEIDPDGFSEHAASLVAEICWYFMDGYSQRVGDFPIGSKKDYLKFTVHLDDFKDEIIFYKSHRSDRWWMEVPYPMEQGRKYERHYLVPCNHADYELAMKNELPDLWWKTYQKLSLS